MLKKVFNLSLMAILSIFFGIKCVSAVECNYSILECVDSDGYIFESNLDYSINSSCQFVIDQGNDKIKLDSYNSGESSSANGGREDLQNWNDKNYCPNIIRITKAPWYDVFDTFEWYGYEDLQSAREASTDYDYIFVLDKHLEELKSNATTFDSTVSYTCQYEYFSIDFNKDGYALSAKSTLDISPIAASYNYTLSKNMLQTQSITPGECENAYYCLSSSSGVSPVSNSYMIFVDEFDYEANKDSCQDVLLIGKIHFSSGDFDNYCRTYSTYINTLKQLSNDCEKSLSACNEYNKTKNEVSSICKSIMKYGNFGESDCLKSCLNYITDIQEIEKMITPAGQCGFSWKLINWIANIVKWVKYIVPVIVIVMGILDFIKAIANGKEDEMKKAQGHFIKRLIAAALIFIIPFIIEFILNKMGFDANGCGIIDL